MKRALVLLPLALGCKPSQEADQSLDEALRSAFLSLDESEEEAAVVLRALERATYRTVPVGSSDVAKRGVTPKNLSAEHLASIEPRPDADPVEAVPAVALAHLSPHDVVDHARIQLVVDHAAAGLEPSSPDHYDRVFLEGEACWLDRGCDWLRTVQELTKVYRIVQPIPYTLHKDFRWVDLSLGTDADEPRWAYVARSWVPEPGSSQNGKNTIWQSYTVEVWLPRDGQGFLWAESEEEPESSDFVDSQGEGTLRLISLWAESELGGLVFDETTEVGVIRVGMDQIFDAHDAWLADQAD